MTTRNRHLRRFVSKPLRLIVQTVCMLALLLAPVTAIADASSDAASYAAAQAEANKKNTESRDNQAALAATMAGIGAGIAAMSCAQLYKAAEEADAAMEFATAQMLRTQAAQQCAQAAQNMANQAQNQGTSESLQTPNMDSSQQSTAPVTSTQTPTSSTPVDNNPVAPLTDGNNSNNGLIPDGGTQLAGDNSTAPPIRFEPPANSDLTNSNTNGTTTAATPPAPTTLDTIKNGITYDEGAGTSSPGEVAASQGGSFSGGMGGSGDGKLASNSLFDGIGAGNKALAEEEHARGGGRGRNAKDAGEAGGGDASATGGDASEGGGSFRSMLAGMMGGGGEQAVAGGGLSSVMEIANKGTGKKAPNIFEYANYRYRKLSRETDLGKKKPIRKLASINTVNK